MAPSTGTIVRASYGEGFKAPTLFQPFSEYGNTALTPEEAKGWEAGIEQHLFGDCQDRQDLVRSQDQRPDHFQQLAARRPLSRSALSLGNPVAAPLGLLFERRPRAGTGDRGLGGAQARRFFRRRHYSHVEAEDCRSPISAMAAAPPARYSPTPR